MWEKHSSFNACPVNQLTQHTNIFLSVSLQNFSSYIFHQKVLFLKPPILFVEQLVKLCKNTISGQVVAPKYLLLRQGCRHLYDERFTQRGGCEWWVCNWTVSKPKQHAHRDTHRDTHTQKDTHTDTTNWGLLDQTRVRFQRWFQLPLPVQVQLWWLAVCA